MISKLGLVQISKGQVGVRQVLKGGNYSREETIQERKLFFFELGNTKVTEHKAKGHST